MPTKKPSADFDNQDEILSEGEQTKKWGGQRPRRPRLIIPLTDEGEIDSSRAKPEVLEKARQALGMPANATDTSLPEAAKVPRELVPWVYDGIAVALGKVFQLAKWPKIMTDEERVQFVSGLHYSDEFKEKAKEPTGVLLDRAIGNSKLAAWLMAHSELAVLGKLFAEETVAMVQRAAVPVILARQQVEEKKKENGGFPASEFRPVGGDAVTQ